MIRLGLSACNGRDLDAHRHDDTDEAVIVADGLEHARVPLSAELDRNFVVRHRVQSIEQVSRVEANAQLVAGVVDIDLFAPLANLRILALNPKKTGLDYQLYATALIVGHQADTTESLDQRHPRRDDGPALFAWYDLAVRREVFVSELHAQREIFPLEKGIAPRSCDTDCRFFFTFTLELLSFAVRTLIFLITILGN